MLEKKSVSEKSRQVRCETAGKRDRGTEEQTERRFDGQREGGLRDSETMREGNMRTGNTRKGKFHV